MASLFCKAGSQVHQLAIKADGTVSFERYARSFDLASIELGTGHGMPFGGLVAANGQLKVADLRAIDSLSGWGGSVDKPLVVTGDPAGAVMDCACTFVFLTVALLMRVGVISIVGKHH
jgi:hypothetical protein